jgi:hypothetical protein
MINSFKDKEAGTNIADDRWHEISNKPLVKEMQQHQGSTRYVDVDSARDSNSSHHPCPRLTRTSERSLSNRLISQRSRQSVNELSQGTANRVDERLQATVAEIKNERFRRSAVCRNLVPAGETAC